MCRKFRSKLPLFEMTDILIDTVWLKQLKSSLNKFTFLFAVLSTAKALTGSTKDYYVV